LEQVADHFLASSIPDAKLADSSKAEKLSPARTLGKADERRDVTDFFVWGRLFHRDSKRYLGVFWHAERLRLGLRRSARAAPAATAITSTKPSRRTASMWWTPTRISSAMCRATSTAVTAFHSVRSESSYV
jgi:hypothetical protein